MLDQIKSVEQSQNRPQVTIEEELQLQQGICTSLGFSSDFIDVIKIKFDTHQNHMIQFAKILGTFVTP